MSATPAKIREIRQMAKNGLGNGALREARRLVEAHPGDLAALLLLARVEEESGNDVAAFAAFKRAHRLGDSSGKAAMGLLAILNMRRRVTAARRLADSLSDGSKWNAPFTGNLVEAALMGRDLPKVRTLLNSARNRGLSSALLVRQEKVATSLAAELAAGDSMAGTRHIAIGGVSHVGSTVFGIVLGSVPGLAFAGETHALTEIKSRNNDDQGRVLITESDAPFKLWPTACRVCGRDCEVFDPEFRRDLARNPTGRYARIASRLNVSTLVTTDKNVELYWERDPLFRFDFVLLYKSPAAQMRSNLKNALRKEGEAAAAQLIEQADHLLNRWAANYLGHLRLIAPRGKRVVVNWERLVMDPKRHLRRIGKTLGVPLSIDTCSNIRPGHFIGGNSGVDVRTVVSTGKLELRRSNAPLLPKVWRERIKSHTLSRYVHTLLERQYRLQFGK